MVKGGEEEAQRRVVDGVPDFRLDRHGNKHHSVRYSDTLLMFLLKARRPDKFRDNGRVEHFSARRLCGAVVPSAATKRRVISPALDGAPLPAGPENRLVRRYMIIIEGRNFEDVDEVELIAPPQPGEPIETTLGQCIVVGLESPPANGAFAGKIICRLP